MPMWFLTKEKKEELCKQRDAKVWSLSSSKILMTNSEAKVWPLNRLAADWTKHPEEEESSRPLEGRSCCFLWGARGIGTCLVINPGFMYIQHSKSLVLITFLLFSRVLRQKRRRMLPCLLKRPPEKAEQWKWKWSRRLCPLHRAAELFHESPAPWKLKLIRRQI